MNTKEIKKRPAMITEIARKRLCLLGLTLLFLSNVSNAQVSHGDEVPVSVVLSVGEDGTVKPEWKEAVRNWYKNGLLPPDAFADQHPVSAQEAEWASLILNRARTWSLMADSLRLPFKETVPPDTVYILLGNVGGQDAFTPSDSTIGFDLHKLVDLYGAGTEAENSNRIDRFFAHEFTHLMHKAWRKKHTITLASPLDHALWDCLVEGLGNYRSLSTKWVGENGALTAHAQEVLARLQLVFVERISSLEYASEAEGVVLMEGLSMGPFDQKWGALTVALWLAQDVERKESGLERWIEAGPQGVLTLARKYLPAELEQQLPLR